jgi:toxin HigB-1
VGVKSNFGKTKILFQRGIWQKIDSRGDLRAGSSHRAAGEIGASMEVSPPPHAVATWVMVWYSGSGGGCGMIVGFRDDWLR